jgi:hypothetical protein
MLVVVMNDHGADSGSPNDEATRHGGSFGWRHAVRGDPSRVSQ